MKKAIRISIFAAVVTVIAAGVLFGGSDTEKKARTIKPGDEMEAVVKRLGRPSLKETVSTMMADEKNGGFWCESSEDWVYSRVPFLGTMPTGLRHRLLAIDSHQISVEFDRSNRVIRVQLPNSGSP